MELYNAELVNVSLWALQEKQNIDLFADLHGGNTPNTANCKQWVSYPGSQRWEARLMTSSGKLPPRCAGLLLIPLRTLDCNTCWLWSLPFIFLTFLFSRSPRLPHGAACPSPATCSLVPAPATWETRCLGWLEMRVKYGYSFLRYVSSLQLKYIYCRK